MGRWLLAGLICFAISGARSQSTDPAPPSADRSARWHEDLKFLTSGVSARGTVVDQYGRRTRGQKDFSKLYPRASFDASVNSLEADIPKISDGEVALRLMRIWASANVAHNAVQFPSGMGFSTGVPFSLRWYSDGLAVVAASEEYTHAIGARVVKVGDMTPEQLLSAVAPYIPHENDVWLRLQAGDFIRTEAVLRHLALIGGDGRVEISLEKTGAPPFTISVAPTDLQTRQIVFYDLLHPPTPLFRSHPGEHYKYYWYQFLNDSSTLYIQYDACTNNPQWSFADFSKQALAEADAHPVKRVVIDLRFNGGGDSNIINPLKDGLASRLKSVGHVYVLIGPNTFSSAMLNAMQLRDDLKAILVGEPSGGSPDGYGEVRLLVLPNSKVTVQYTTKFFGDKQHSASSLQPDILAPRTFADALAGRDSTLEAAIAAH